MQRRLSLTRDYAVKSPSQLVTMQNIEDFILLWAKCVLPGYSAWWHRVRCPAWEPSSTRPFWTTDYSWCPLSPPLLRYPGCTLACSVDAHSDLHKHTHTLLLNFIQYMLRLLTFRSLVTSVCHQKDSVFIQRFGPVQFHLTAELLNGI